MGFHSATFGVVLSEHSENPEAIVSLIGSQSHIQDENYVILIHDDIIPITGFMEKETTAEGIKITVNNDDLNELELAYRGDVNIQIGSCYCCHYMIHIGSVCDEQDNLKISIPDGTMYCFMEWKQQLMSTNGLDSDARFQLVGNCCS